MIIKCPMCKKELDENSFNLDKKSKTGRYSYCKECRKPLLRAWGITHREKHREQGGRWEKANREKKSAHNAIKRAIKNGKMLKGSCTVCGQDAVAHHPDYTKKLDVYWLCSKHHAEVHSGLITNEWLAGFHDCDYESCNHFSHAQV